MQASVLWIPFFNYVQSKLFSYEQFNINYYYLHPFICFQSDY